MVLDVLFYLCSLLLTYKTQIQATFILKVLLTFAVKLCETKSNLSVTVKRDFRRMFQFSYPEVRHPGGWVRTCSSGDWSLATGGGHVYLCLLFSVTVCHQMTVSVTILSLTLLMCHSLLAALYWQTLTLATPGSVTGLTAPARSRSVTGRRAPDSRWFVGHQHQRDNESEGVTELRWDKQTSIDSFLSHRT